MPTTTRQIGRLLAATLWLGAAASGCSPPSGASGANQDGAGSDANPGGVANDAIAAGETAVTDSNGRGAADTADVGELPCTCPAHQACSGGLCGDKACTTDADCNPPGGPGADEDSFYCPDGTCRAWQCAKDAHCAGGEKCNTVTYKCYPPATGCTLDTQCVDDDACTDDVCDVAKGTCTHELIKGCCKVAADCDDSDPCTTETCNAGKCDWKGIGGCCSKDAECDDGDSCTTDTCGSGGCKHLAAAGCCKSASQCNDGDPTTTDSCDTSSKACVHALAGAPSSCKADADCSAGACAKGSCVGGSCSYASTGAAACCSTVATCALGSQCKAASCSAWSCAATPVTGGKQGPHLSWDFEQGTDGWVVSKDNATAYFHQAKGWSGHGKGSLRYGVPGKETWKGGVPNNGKATSPAFVVPKGARVEALVFFDGEPGAGVHQFGLEVVSGGVGTPVWSKNADLKGNTAGAWKTLSVELGAFAGKSVQLRWWFDVAVNFPKEDGKGLHLDAVQILGPCP